MKSRTGTLLIMILLSAMVALPIICAIQDSSEKGSPSRATELKTALSYLNEIEGVRWIEIDDNNVYIGFDPLPPDYVMICKGAALKGNKTIDFGVHVWAINAKKYQWGWRPGDGPLYYETTARYGKIQD